MSTICYKHLNLVEVAEKGKCDNNSDSSDQNGAHKTHSYETKRDILKHIDSGVGHGEIARSLGLSRSTINTTVKKYSYNYKTCKSVGSLQSIMVNPNGNVLIEEMEHLLKI
jgi:translation initiation factor 2 beta subunit (eIF-2beta)/eIF-5